MKPRPDYIRLVPPPNPAPKRPVFELPAEWVEISGRELEKRLDALGGELFRVLGILVASSARARKPALHGEYVSTVSAREVSELSDGPIVDGKAAWPGLDFGTVTRAVRKLQKLGLVGRPLCDGTAKRQLFVWHSRVDPHAPPHLYISKAADALTRAPKGKR